MSFAYNSRPTYFDEEGKPYEFGLLFYGLANVDPIQNPQDIFLDEARTVQANNPQEINEFGATSQGAIYMLEGDVRYSQLLQDVDGNQIFNEPSIIGVTPAVDFNNLPAATVIDSLTIKGNTDADVNINSGVSTGSEGTLTYQEDAVSQWRWLRQAIVDGGAIILRKLVGAGAPDDPIEFPTAGGMIARWLGTDRLRIESDGIALLGELKNTKQVLVAGGTFLHGGSAVGETTGITSAGNTGTGTYTVVLDFFPTAEADLLVEASALDATGIMLARGVGGAQGTGTVIISTGASNAALSNATSFTVSVFDLGRS